ncbi:MAG TPA: hypothetical protein VFV73_30225 [Streptosporangiaceae bacterium]|nr:hypothetical protein [Streptosporangiaceae bacterium]
MLWAVGRHLGSLAGRDLAARCAEGRLDAKGRSESRRERKRALTAASSSRWAGAITRTSEDAWQLASRTWPPSAPRWTPACGRLELKLPVPLAHLANRPVAASGCPARQGSSTGATR